MNEAVEVPIETRIVTVNGRRLLVGTQLQCPEHLHVLAQDVNRERKSIVIGPCDACAEAEERGKNEIA